MNDENIEEDNPDNAENGEQDLNEALETLKRPWMMASLPHQTRS